MTKMKVVAKAGVSTFSYILKLIKLVGTNNINTNNFKFFFLQCNPQKITFVDQRDPCAKYCLSKFKFYFVDFNRKKKPLEYQGSWKQNLK